MRKAPRFPLPEAPPERWQLTHDGRPLWLIALKDTDLWAAVADDAYEVPGSAHRHVVIDPVGPIQMPTLAWTPTPRHHGGRLRVEDKEPSAVRRAARLCD